MSICVSVCVRMLALILLVDALAMCHGLCLCVYVCAVIAFKACEAAANCRCAKQGRLLWAGSHMCLHRQ